MNEEISIEEMKKIEELKRILMKKILSKEALERLGRVRMVKPELAAQVELYLIQLFQTGKIKNEITEGMLIKILENIKGKKEFRIVK
ncbi:MAG: DNA-binding protein [Candidatus Aenigmatarchaeota archaeon]